MRGQEGGGGVMRGQGQKYKGGGGGGVAGSYQFTNGMRESNMRSAVYRITGNVELLYLLDFHL